MFSACFLHATQLIKSASLSPSWLENGLFTAIADDRARHSDWYVYKKPDARGHAHRCDLAHQARTPARNHGRWLRDTDDRGQAR